MCLSETSLSLQKQLSAIRKLSQHLPIVISIKITINDLCEKGLQLLTLSSYNRCIGVCVCECVDVCLGHTHLFVF